MDRIDQIAFEMDSLYKNLLTHKWVQYTTGFDLGVSQAQASLNTFKKEPESFRTICQTLEKASNPLDQRKARILYGYFKPFHQSEKVQKLLEKSQNLENSIMDLVNKYRAKIDEKEMSSLEINKILSQSSDQNLRKKAYISRIPLNQIIVDAGFLKLLDIRKELALASGYENFIDYKLDEQDLKSNLFDDWKTLCRQRVSRYKQKEKRLAQKYLNTEDLQPWDYGFLKSQICSYNQTQVDLTNFYEPISKIFLKHGFEINKLNLTYDIFPRKNKSEWGYNFNIGIGKDSRILANVSNRFSNYWVLLHETAHGVHFMGLNSEENAFNYGVSGIVAEGFANYFGNLSYSKEFLNEVLSPEIADKSLADFQQLEQFMHFQNYQSISDILFDQELYIKDFNSEKDIQDLRQDMNSQITGESANEIPWARLIHHTSAPIYLHNYFLGDIMCENMKTIFKKHNSGKTADQEPLKFGNFWKEQVLAPSGRYSFLELYEKVCKEKISIVEYLDNKCLA